MNPVASSQFLTMKDSFARDGINIEAAYTPDGEIDYIYVVGRLLALDRDDNLEQLRAVLPGLSRMDQDEQPAVGDLLRLSIENVTIRNSDPGALTVPEVLDHVLSDNPRLAGLITPLHIVHIQKKTCPAVEPEVPSAYPTEPWPPPNPAGGGQDVRVSVSDTGLQRNLHQYHWMSDVSGVEEPLGLTLPDGLQDIPKYAGHGTFVAGVVKCMAPGATVFVNSHFTMSGAVEEYSLIQALEELIQDQSPDLLSLSAGVYTDNDFPPLAFIDFRDRHPDIPLIAAAGNDSTDRPFYPAALPWVVGVGALATDQRHRAWFSNYGDWVKVYALGEGLVNAYATGIYTYQEPPKQPAKQTFYGMARWDGTSFSTPLVAGLIAEEMAASGTSAQDATRAVLTRASAQAIPGVGPALFPPQTPPFP
jgi:Subtilase family